jgi:hypothetical protein
VRDAGVKQDAFCRCRLPGVDVRHDSDVPATIQRYGASHVNNPCGFIRTTKVTPEIPPL